MQRFVGVLSGVAALLAGSLLALAALGRQPLQQAPWLLLALVPFAFFTGFVSHRTLRTLQPGAAFLQRLLLRSVLPPWAVVGVWLVVAFSLGTVAVLSRGIGPAPLDLVLPAILFALFFSDATILLFAKHRVPSKVEQSAA